MSTSPDDVLHCPHCLAVVHPHSHFCQECGMPLTSYSTIGPMEQVWAFGWLVNRLLVQRPSGFLCSLCYVLLVGRVTLSYFRHRGAPTTANDDAT